MTYVLWKTLGRLCCRSGLGDESRRVVGELAELRSMDVVLPTEAGVEIHQSCISRASDR